MKLVVFGLTVSSSFGNDHATLWRGLICALERRGHDVVFFERDQPEFAAHRDLTDLGEADLVFYSEWSEVRVKAMAHLLDADVAMVTSCCPDLQAASDLVHEHAHVGVFYDLNTPRTLACLARGEAADVPAGGMGAFDLVLSAAGGPALEQLKTRLGAQRVCALYAHADPDAWAPAAADPRRACDLSYLPPTAKDAAPPSLEPLFVAPARRRSDLRLLASAVHLPADLPDNIAVLGRLTAGERPAVYAASRLTLSLTPGDDAQGGWFPTARLFEAAACGAAILSDAWPGLEHFFTPGREILVASTLEEALAALDRPDAELRAIGQAARERVLDEHTSDHRAGELLNLLADLVEGVLPLEVPHADARTLAETLV